jgi:hypothetical protein
VSAAAPESNLVPFTVDIASPCFLKVWCVKVSVVGFSGGFRIKGLVKLSLACFEWTRSKA